MVGVSVNNYVRFLYLHLDSTYHPQLEVFSPHPAISEGSPVHWTCKTSFLQKKFTSSQTSLDPSHSSSTMSTATPATAATKDESHPLKKGPTVLRSILAGSTAGAVEIGE